MASATVTDRVFNFSPGPAVMPLPVLEQAQRELVCLPGYGMSVLEMSHRSPGFLEILASTKSLLRELLGIPANYQIVFLQGGSRLQFSMIPINLLRGQSQPADYVLTGSWSKMALDEAKREGNVNVAWDGKSTNYDRLPKAAELKLNPSAPYVYTCSNETIQGVQFQTEVDTGNVPLVCDASSDFLHRPLPIAKYGLLYACAQKNAGSAGVTALIIRDDLLARSSRQSPRLPQLQKPRQGRLPLQHAAHLRDLPDEAHPRMASGRHRRPRQNAPAQQGKGQAPLRRHRQLRRLLQRPRPADDRSLMNVTFRLPSEQLEKEFVKEGEDRALDGLKGHRSVGGIRASIYNAMPREGVESLATFMREFKRNAANPVVVG